MTETIFSNFYDLLGIISLYLACIIIIMVNETRFHDYSFSTEFKTIKGLHYSLNVVDILLELFIILWHLHI